MQANLSHMSDSHLFDKAVLPPVILPSIPHKMRANA